MGHRLPRIGLNMACTGANKPPAGQLSVGTAYIDALWAAGGLPVPLPPLKDLQALGEALEELDGICFIGGPDYLPGHYGGRAQKAEELMEERRDRFDLALARRVLKMTALPVLGVCGGNQLLSIALGGALVQDLGTEWTARAPERALPHAGGPPEQRQTYRYRHPVRLEPGSLIARVLSAAGPGLLVNSHHHQAVRPEAVGEGLRASAWAPDGVVEALEPAPGSAFEKSGRFVLGVQWHPERMPEEEVQLGIFRALVDAARGKA